MGQHTWFYSDKDKYNSLKELYEKEYNHEECIEWLHDYELLEVQEQIDKLEKEIKTNYHDCFRTSKREPSGEYTLDIIYSKEECYKWLEDNKEFVYDKSIEHLNRFWEEYPNGCIDFG